MPNTSQENQMVFVLSETPPILFFSSGGGTKSPVPVLMKINLLCHTPVRFYFLVGCSGYLDLDVKAGNGMF